MAVLEAQIRALNVAQQQQNHQLAAIAQMLRMHWLGVLGEPLQRRW
jgi:hypothetical protein